MGIAEEEGRLLVFDTGILNTIFPQTVEMKARLLGNIGVHIPNMERLSNIS